MKRIATLLEAIAAGDYRDADWKVQEGLDRQLRSDAESQLRIYQPARQVAHMWWLAEQAVPEDDQKELLTWFLMLNDLVCQTWPSTSSATAPGAS